MACQRDLLEAMEDEAFVDITLVGTDSLEVPCNKFMLGTRSPIFKKMFFAGFQEKNKVCLDYPSVVLKVLVKYCYSDEVDLGLILVHEDESLTDQEATTLVQLRDAARYFELLDVANQFEKEIGDLVFQDKQTGCVCAILSELMHRIDDEGPFWDVFLQLAIHKPEECLLPKSPSEVNQGAMACHPLLLAKLLDMLDDTNVVVRCLAKWFDNASIEEEYNESLVKISKEVDLKELSLVQLSTIEPSPLFPMPRIYEALIYHGKRAEAQEQGSINNVVYVSGSGVKGLNGYYYQPFFIFSNTYQKEGMYGEIACHFEVKCLPRDAKWTISVIPKEKNSVPLNMYEALSTETVQPPFKRWECVEGAGPAPLVVMINTRSPVPKQLPNPPSRPIFHFGGTEGVASTVN
ncbi:MAG: hypothetical protein SGBAC_009624 [Bacillariaceae sp.]